MYTYILLFQNYTVILFVINLSLITYFFVYNIAVIIDTQVLFKIIYIILIIIAPLYIVYLLLLIPLIVILPNFNYILLLLLSSAIIFINVFSEVLVVGYLLMKYFYFSLGFVILVVFALPCSLVFFLKIKILFRYLIFILIVNFIILNLILFDHSVNYTLIILIFNIVL